MGIIEEKKNSRKIDKKICLAAGGCGKYIRKSRGDAGGCGKYTRICGDFRV